MMKERVALELKGVEDIKNGQYRLDMPVEQKKMFVIFGTTKGLGKELFNYARKFANRFLTINRRKTIRMPNTKSLIIDMSKPLTEANTNKIIKYSFKYSEKIYFINNASTIDPIGPAGCFTNAEISDAVYLNYINYVKLINKIIGAVKSAPDKDVRILNISSAVVNSPHFGLSVYRSSKSAMESFTESVFREQENLGEIKISALHPGIMDTSMQNKMRRTNMNKFPESDFYGKLFKTGKLMNTAKAAKIIYDNILTEKYWEKPITEISDL